MCCLNGLVLVCSVFFFSCCQLVNKGKLVGQGSFDLRMVKVNLFVYYLI